MRKKYQKGGFKYDKVGNTSITSKDINKINKATGIQFTPEYLNYINKDRVGIASMQEGGEIEKYQPGGYKNRGYDNPFIPKRKTTVPTPPQYSYPAPTPSNPNQPFTGYGIPMPKTPWEASGVANKNYGRTVDAGGVAQQPTTQATNFVTAPTPSTDEQNPASTPQFQRPPVPTNTDMEMEAVVTPENSNPSKYTIEEALKGEMLTDWGNSLNNSASLTTSNQTQEQQTAQPFQFNNYFNGVSIPQAAGYLGESIKNKDTLGIVTSGLKLATGLGRNVLSGMGSQNRENQIMKQYTEEQRNVLTQANRPAQLTDQGYGEDTGRYQEGGQTGTGQEEMVMQVAQALQQGADPQEVLQQLLQMGLEESEAIQLIEGIMQQMQQESPQQEIPQMQNGGEYLNQIKGKRIVDYKFNPETGNYDIEYED